jgi:hypothetical protein
MIKDAESGTYRGLLGDTIAKALQELEEKCRVTILAFVKAPNSLSIIFYGLCIESATVGDILVEYDLYLQLPTSFDNSVPYQNPQSFSVSSIVETAQDMPLLKPRSTGPVKSSMSELITKSKVRELLDSATGPEEFREVKASSKLVTKLKT